MDLRGIDEVEVSQLLIGDVEGLDVVQRAKTREGRQIVVRTCGETASPDVYDRPVATFWGVFCPTPFGLFVKALRSVGDERQIWGSDGVSVGPTGKRGELTLDSEAIALEARALVVAGETEALHNLRLATGGRSHGDDVVELLDCGLFAHGAFLVLGLSYRHLLLQAQILPRGPHQSLEHLQCEIWKSLALPDNGDSRELFESLKPRQDLVHFLVQVLDGADAFDAIQGLHALQGDHRVVFFALRHLVQSAHLAQFVSHQMQILCVEEAGFDDALPRSPSPHVWVLVIFLQVFALDPRFNVHLEIEGWGIHFLQKPFALRQSCKDMGVLVDITVMVHAAPGDASFGLAFAFLSLHNPSRTGPPHDAVGVPVFEIAPLHELF